MAELPRKPFKARVLGEMKTYFLVSLYLAIFFSVFTNYRRMVLAQYQIGYSEYGVSIIEAMVLGKVIAIGKALRVGERFRRRPLIVSTLWKTFCFSILVLVFDVVEQGLKELIRGKRIEELPRSLLGADKWEILARVLMLVTVFAPLFATWEIGRVLGEGKLYQLFFRARPEPPAEPIAA